MNEVTLDSMIRHARKIIGELEQFIRDTEWWNANRTDSDPMDCEGEKLLLHEARLDLECLLRGDTIQSAVHSKRMIDIARESIAFGEECFP